MTREKIRDGIAEAIYTDWAINSVSWGKTLPGEKTPWLKTADKVMLKEHSQGVVIRVDREWPEWVGCWLLNRLGIGNKFDTFNRRFCEDLIRDAIAAVTEPLIEEG